MVGEKTESISGMATRSRLLCLSSTESRTPRKTDNGLVLDCFLGSASTLMACEQINRICYGIELEPKFVDVAVKRYIEFTGSDQEVFVIRDGQKLPYSSVAPTSKDTE